jgi:hypothetical protein
MFRFRPVTTLHFVPIDTWGFYSSAIFDFMYVRDVLRQLDTRLSSWGVSMLKTKLWKGVWKVLICRYVLFVFRAADALPVRFVQPYNSSGRRFHARYVLEYA